MRRGVSLLLSLLLYSTPLGETPAQGEILDNREFSIPAEAHAYCHTRFPAMHEDGSSEQHPIFNDGLVHAVAFYGSCDYDPLGLDEINTPQPGIFGGIGGGE